MFSESFKIPIFNAESRLYFVFNGWFISLSDSEYKEKIKLGENFDIRHFGAFWQLVLVNDAHEKI